MSFRFDWRDFITYANGNDSFGSPQFDFRSKISRGYYGVFHECRIYKNIIKKSSDIHKLISEEFTKSDSSPEEYTIGKNLDSLRMYRNDADYDGTKEYKPQEFNYIIELMNTTLNALKKLKEDS